MIKVSVDADKKGGVVRKTRPLSWFEIQSVFATWAAHAKHDEYSLRIWNVLLDDLRSRAESSEEPYHP